MIVGRKNMKTSLVNYAELSVINALRIEINCKINFYVFFQSALTIVFKYDLH